MKTKEEVWCSNDDFRALSAKYLTEGDVTNSLGLTELVERHNGRKLSRDGASSRTKDQKKSKTEYQQIRSNASTFLHVSSQVRGKTLFKKEGKGASAKYTYLGEGG